MRKHRTVKFVAALIFLAALFYCCLSLVTAIWLATRGLGAGWGSGWRGWVVIPVLIGGLLGAAGLLVCGAVLYFLAQIENNLALAARRPPVAIPPLPAPETVATATVGLAAAPTVAAPAPTVAEPAPAEQPEVGEGAGEQGSRGAVAEPVPAIEVTAGRAEAPQFRFPTVEIFEGEAESVAPAAPEEKPAPLESALTAADRLAAELPAELPAAEPAEAKLEAGARSGLRLPGSEEVARIAAEMAALRSADRREPARAEVTAPPAASPAMPVAAPLSAEVEDDLLAILGIGPVYARRLREAGITTFAALAEANDEVLEKITAGNLERVIRDDWRGQARRLAGRL